jgi:hypothetical protein
MFQFVTVCRINIAKEIVKNLEENINFTLRKKSIHMNKCTNILKRNPQNVTGLK